jgi:hypothetical protein
MVLGRVGRAIGEVLCGREEGEGRVGRGEKEKKTRKIKLCRKINR